MSDMWLKVGLEEDLKRMGGKLLVSRSLLYDPDMRDKLFYAVLKSRWRLGNVAERVFGFDKDEIRDVLRGQVLDLCSKKKEPPLRVSLISDEQPNLALMRDFVRCRELRLNDVLPIKRTIKAKKFEIQESWFVTVATAMPIFKDDPYDKCIKHILKHFLFWDITPDIACEYIVCPQSDIRCHYSKLLDN